MSKNKFNIYEKVENYASLFKYLGAGCVIGSLMQDNSPLAGICFGLYMVGDIFARASIMFEKRLIKQNNLESKLEEK